MNRLSIGSLFAGVGGFDLGFERAGFDVKWCVEWDKHAQQVLRTRFPNAAIHGDIREVDPADLAAVDVVCGGFPCQDLSVAGKRRGLAGERSGLFHEAMRIVRGVRPRLVVVENVAGLLSSNLGHDFAVVLRELGEGWGCAEVGWRVLDSRFFGVPQRRRRVFLVAGASNGCAEQILALAEGSGGNPAEVCCSWQERQDAADPAVDSGAVRGCGIGESVYGIDGDLNATVGYFGTLQSGPHFRQSVCFPIQDCRGLEKVQNGVGVGGADSPAYTIDTLATQAVAVSPMTLRKLTPTECERLQGFPDGWTQLGSEEKPTPDARRYKQMGNAVTVNVAEWIARRSRVFLEGVRDD